MLTDQQTFELIQGELDYGREKWEKNRPEHPHSPADVDKSIAEWLTWMRLELRAAEEAAYQTYDKTAALHRIRALAAHAVNCLKHHDAPSRHPELGEIGRCEQCIGTGRVHGEICHKCGGWGKIVTVEREQ